MVTDIQVLKRFDEFLNYRFFTAMSITEISPGNHVEDQLTSQGYKKNKRGCNH